MESDRQHGYPPLWTHGDTTTERKSEIRAKVAGRGQRPKDLNDNFQILVEIIDNDTDKSTTNIYSSPESD